MNEPTVPRIDRTLNLLVSINKTAITCHKQVEEFATRALLLDDTYAVGIKAIAFLKGLDKLIKEFNSKK